MKDQRMDQQLSNKKVDIKSTLMKNAAMIS